MPIAQNGFGACGTLVIMAAGPCGRSLFVGSQRWTDHGQGLFPGPSPSGSVPRPSTQCAADLKKTIPGKPRGHQCKCAAFQGPGLPTLR